MTHYEYYKCIIQFYIITEQKGDPSGSFIYVNNNLIDIKYPEIQLVYTINNKTSNCL